MMMAATAFVMLQTPAMGIAQAGMIRRKNSLSMLMQTLSGLFGSILWFFRVQPDIWAQLKWIY